MPINIEAERDFHNKRFSEGDSRVSQEKYYWAIEPTYTDFWDRVVRLSRGKDVLEYGCASGARSMELADRANSVCGIDISDVAIASATETAPDNAAFHVMDAMNMDFDDASFDLVFGCGIVHHLDIEQSMREVARVLRPGGTAIFWEPLGLNPMINLYRALTPTARTVDEHPLKPADLKQMSARFSRMDVKRTGLTALLATPLRRSRFGERLRDALGVADGAILAVPGLKHMAWYSVIELSK